MDKEGAETGALHGAIAAITTLATSRRVLQIATNHKPDDSTAIPESVRSIDPSYQGSFHGCTPTKNQRFQPESILFR
jgi:hypothetical protein